MVLFREVDWETGKVESIKVFICLGKNLICSMFLGIRLILGRGILFSHGALMRMVRDLFWMKRIKCLNRIR
jgi:hypothetical protein